MSLGDKEVKIINPNGEKGIGFYFPAGEVKKFIEELKERLFDAHFSVDDVFVSEIVDELAGDKLI